MPKVASSFVAFRYVREANHKEGDASHLPLLVKREKRVLDDDVSRASTSGGRSNIQVGFRICNGITDMPA